MKLSKLHNIPSYASIGHADPKFAQIWFWNGKLIVLPAIRERMDSQGKVIPQDHDDKHLSNFNLTSPYRGRADWDSEQISIIPGVARTSETNATIPPALLKALKAEWPGYEIWYLGHRHQQQIQ